MSFTFNPNEPARNSNPSVSQPIMQQNNQSTNDIIAIDHITFNAANGGKHKQVSFNDNNIPAANPSGTQSILYTKPGTLNTTPQAIFVNSAATFPFSAIRAFGSFSRIGATILTSYNVVSVSNANPFVIVLTAGCTTGNNVCVLLTQDSNPGTVNASYSYTNPNLSISYTGAGFTTMNFVVLQF